MHTPSAADSLPVSSALLDLERGASLREFNTFGLPATAQTLVHLHSEADVKRVVNDPELVFNASSKVGSQCIVVAIDAKQVAPGQWHVFTHGGRNDTGLDAVDWAKRVEMLGAGEVLLTSMDRDGTKNGFDLALTRAVSDAVKIPVIASGGVGNLQHLADGVTEGRADAVLAASIFHFGEYTVRQAKEYMASRGIEVRL